MAAFLRAINSYQKERYCINPTNKKVTKMKTVNYTDEMTATVVKMYNELGNDGVADIAEAVGRSVRSVRSKLVREKVYVAPVKPEKVAVDTGPSKKEMLIELSGIVAFDTAGLTGATKEAIGHVIELAKA